MMNSLISLLLTSRDQAHIFHLQTASYSAHKALDEYYSGIVNLVDGLVESYQGKYGIVSGYSLTGKMIENASIDSMIEYFTKLVEMVEQTGPEFNKDTYIQNQIDEVVTLIRSTLYKLQFLK